MYLMYNKDNKRFLQTYEYSKYFENTNRKQLIGWDLRNVMGSSISLFNTLEQIEQCLKEFQEDPLCRDLRNTEIYIISPYCLK